MLAFLVVELTCALIFLVTAVLPLRPFLRIGMISASDGGSTECTKEVRMRSWSARLVWMAGSLSAASSTGTRVRISGALITLPICLRAARLAVCTLAFGSVITSSSRGTIIGRHADSCCGEQYAMADSRPIDSSFVRHCFSSRALSTRGRTWKKNNKKERKGEERATDKRKVNILTSPTPSVNRSITNYVVLFLPLCTRVCVCVPPS